MADAALPAALPPPLLLLLLVGCASGVSVEGHVAGVVSKVEDVDPDEYLWSKLTGRCCMQLRLECPFPNAPQSMCKNVGPASCNDCKVQRTSQQSGRVMMEAAVPGGTACVGRVRLSERAAPS